MRAKITYLEGDFPSYIVSSREECRNCVDHFVYDVLKGWPDDKCVQVGKVCVERLGGGVDRVEVKRAMDRLLETIERSLEAVQSCVETSKRTLRVSGEEV